MPIYRFGRTAIERVEETTFGSVGVRERTDLQRLLREHIEVISPNTLIISEEFGEWEESRRRIDLLGMDEDSNLVVIEGWSEVAPRDEATSAKISSIGHQLLTHSMSKEAEYREATMMSLLRLDQARPLLTRRSRI